MVLAVYCLFASDIHGLSRRYTLLFQQIEKEKPDAVFLGGDLLSLKHFSDQNIHQFIEKNIFQNIKNSRKKLQKNIRFFVILGNDDPRRYEQIFQEADMQGIIDYIHQKTVAFQDIYVTGYSYVPPTPFQLKDWERYDVSRYVDVGSVSPEEGIRTVEVDSNTIRYATIAQDLENLSKNAPLEKTIFLFHSPPYKSYLDRAALDGKSVDHAPLDVHIGSIAIKRFILNKQPFLTLHGHAHESTRLTGQWKQQFGKTLSFNAAHDTNDLVIITFDTTSLGDATRKIIPVDER